LNFVCEGKILHRYVNTDKGKDGAKITSQQLRSSEMELKCNMY